MADNNTARALRLVQEAREIESEPIDVTTMAQLEVRKIEMMAIIVESLDDICSKLGD